MAAVALTKNLQGERGREKEEKGGKKEKRGERKEEKKERKGEKSKRERCRCIRPMGVKHPLEMSKKDYKHDKRHEKGGLNLKKKKEKEKKKTF